MPKTLEQLKEDWDKQGMVGAMKQAQDFNLEQYKLIMRLFWSFLWGTIQAEREELRSKIMELPYSETVPYVERQAVLDLLPPNQ